MIPSSGKQHSGQLHDATRNRALRCGERRLPELNAEEEHGTPFWKHHSMVSVSSRSAFSVESMGKGPRVIWAFGRSSAWVGKPNDVGFRVYERSKITLRRNLPRNHYDIICLRCPPSIRKHLGTLLHHKQFICMSFETVNL